MIFWEMLTISDIHHTSRLGVKLGKLRFVPKGKPFLCCTYLEKGDVSALGDCLPQVIRKGCEALQHIIVVVGAHHKHHLRYLVIRVTQGHLDVRGWIRKRDHGVKGVLSKAQGKTKDNETNKNNSLRQ